jgi:hypothetical protein
MTKLEISNIFEKEDNYYFLKNENINGAKIKIYYPIGFLDPNLDANFYGYTLSNIVRQSFTKCHLDYQVFPNYTLFTFNIFDHHYINEMLGKLWNTMNGLSEHSHRFIDKESLEFFYDEWIIPDDIQRYEDVELVTALSMQRAYLDQDIKETFRKTCEYFTEKNAIVFYTSKDSIKLVSRNDVEFEKRAYNYNLENIKKKYPVFIFEDPLMGEIFNVLLRYVEAYTIDQQIIDDKYTIIFVGGLIEKFKESMTLLKDKLEEIFVRELVLNVITNVANNFFERRLVIDNFDYKVTCLLNDLYYPEENDELRFYSYSYDDVINEFRKQIEVVICDH